MELASVIRRIAPEVRDVLERRYRLLQAVQFMAPVGRRNLAQKLVLSERVARRELALLQNRGLVEGDAAGARISQEGIQVLDQLQGFIRVMRGLDELEAKIVSHQGVDRAIVVPGDSDEDELTGRELAQATAEYLRTVLREGDVLAVTGGSTLSQVARCFPQERISRDITVVPARGGLGEDVELQANSIAALLAQRLGGRYKLLHAPDNVVPGMMDTFVNEPRIREVIGLARRCQVLLHGIGTAEEMAKRRGMDEEHLMRLVIDGAVGEAFGYYFNPRGDIVYSTPSVGLRLADLEHIPVIAAVGGGRSKAWAVLAVLAIGQCNVCITDEGAARRLLNITCRGGTKHGYSSRD